MEKNHKKPKTLGLYRLKSFFYFFDDLHFISAIPIQNNIYENPRIDHWECHFNVDLKVSENNNEKSILKNSSIIIKLANNGRIIALHYHYTQEFLTNLLRE